MELLFPIKVLFELLNNYDDFIHITKKLQEHKAEKKKKYKIFVSPNPLNPPLQHSHDIHPHHQINQPLPPKKPKSLVQNIIVRLIEIDERKLS